MKTSLQLLLLAAVLCMPQLSCSSRQQPKPQKAAAPPAKRLAMQGYGKVFYDADVCDLTFRVITPAGNDLEAAFEQHRQKLNEVSDFMGTYGDSRTICALTASLLQRGERRVNNKLIIEYSYRSDFMARIYKIDDLLGLQASLVQQGVNQITHMELRSSKYKELLNKARDLAISDARDKVAYIANATGQEVADLVDLSLVKENLYSWRYGQQKSYGARGRQIQDQTSPYETYIDVFVNATFQLKKPDPS
jgi:uncharacterized protein YggE